MSGEKWTGILGIEQEAIYEGNIIRQESLPDGIGPSSVEHFACQSPRGNFDRNAELDGLGEDVSDAMANLAWNNPLPANFQRNQNLSMCLRHAESMRKAFGVPIAAKPNAPDISKGLGQQQSKKDLASLERYIKSNLTLMVYRETLCVFEPPCWKWLNEHQAESRFRAILESANINFLAKHDYHAIWRNILLSPELQVEEEIVPPSHKLNLLDGTYDLNRERLLPHNPEDYFFSSVNVSYSDIEACSGTAFENFVDNISSGNEDIREQLLQLVAFTMLGSQIKHFFVLLGPSNTGKTQFGRFLIELIGHDHVATIQGVKEFSGRFTTGSMEDKRLATCLDLPDGPLPSTAVGVIKQLVGDDPIKAEQKYKDPHTFYQKPLLLLAGNHPIQIPNMEQEGALLNRMVTIPFQNPVSNSVMRRQFYEALLEEAPYIVGQAIEAYYRFEDNNAQVTRVELPEEFTPGDSNPEIRSIMSFLRDCCVVSPDSKILTKDLYAAYCEYTLCDFEELSFAKRLSPLLEHMDGVKRIKRMAGKDLRGYQGLALRTE